MPEAPTRRYSLFSSHLPHPIQIHRWGTTVANESRKGKSILCRSNAPGDENVSDILLSPGMVSPPEDDCHIHVDGGVLIYLALTLPPPTT